MLEDHKVEKMPEALSFKKLLGPSFILLGLGLGSGEIILWPYLTSNFGMVIIWGAILGITFQFFMNMEIERYSLTRGESVFVGFARKFKWAPIWFIFSTFAGFAWPGIVAASAKLLGELMGVSGYNYIAIGLLILMGLILTLGPILYKTMERFSMLLIGLGIPAIFVLTLFLAKSSDWQALASGLVNFGYLPVGIPIASFLAAFAFSGAGGNLNLAQSLYIKEKGYGMGKFSGRITSILTGKAEDIKLEGARFEMNDDNLSKFRSWWKLINIEHFIVFWATGAFAICMLSLLAYATAFGTTTPASGINFVVFEAQAIAVKTLPIFGSAFLLIGGLMLFSTQMTVLDATSRIMSENLLILEKGRWNPRRLPLIYYSFLWAQIVVGIIIFLTGRSEPLFLLTIEAVVNAGAMFVHIGAITLLNIFSLEKPIRPGVLRIGAMLAAFAFFGYFLFRIILGIRI
jgi:hypothetical protein